VPLSSDRAVVAKSTGAALDQLLMVIAGTSGEPKRTDSRTVSSPTITMAMVPSLMMS
jgi:hypothetical protein